MYCKNCGTKYEKEDKYCNNCGNNLTKEESYQAKPQDKIDLYQKTNNPYKAEVEVKELKEKEIISIKNENEKESQPLPIKKESKLLYYVCGTLIFVCLIFIVSAIFMINNKDSKKVYFDTDRNKEQEIVTSNIVLDEDETSISMNNKYYGQTILTKEQALQLIINDSTKEKKKCTNSEIAAIEEEIEQLGITAVNLCELDIEVATELKEAIKYVYDLYPITKKYLTNFTLYNSEEMNLGDNTMAFFLFHLDFAYSENTYPYAAKTLIAINSSYFLNKEKLDRTLSYSSQSGHFPKNATKGSVVIHELGHYLSYIVAVNEYQKDGFLITSMSNLTTLQTYTNQEVYQRKTSKSIIEEAYENYKKSYDDLKTEDEFRASISKYAMSKNDKNEYLYDETIAEAFHDYYLNKENASKASIEIYKVLDARLKELN